jgi:acyl transferase domain-containing protein
MSYADSYDPNGGVAIVGLAGTLPRRARRARVVAQSRGGRRGHLAVLRRRARPGRSRGDGEPPEARVRAARGILEGIDLFDAAFFGLSPAEVDVIDPQQRLFLEACWEALENAGYAPETCPGPVGVFAGMTNNSYFLGNVRNRPDAIERIGSLQAMMGNEKDYLATRVAYKLDLRGPALNIQTACSTSLVAVCQAVQSLLTYQCDMALAAGLR